MKAKPGSPLASKNETSIVRRSHRSTLEAAAPPGSAGTGDNKLVLPGWFVILMALLFSVVAQAQVFTMDDGSVDDFGGTAGGDLLALNHFNTGGTPVLIDEIRVLWNPLSSSVSPTVALYADPNGDGNPSDMTPLLIQSIFIPPGVVILNNTAVSGYAIPATLVNGSFFVGAYLSDREISFDPSIGVDLAHLAPNQSWIIENSTAGSLNLLNPIGTSTLTTRLDTFVAANHMIEAHFVPVPEPSLTLFIGLGGLCLVVRIVRHKLAGLNAQR